MSNYSYSQSQKGGLTTASRRAHRDAMICSEMMATGRVTSETAGAVKRIVKRAAKLFPGFADITAAEAAQACIDAENDWDACRLDGRPWNEEKQDLYRRLGTRMAHMGEVAHAAAIRDEFYRLSRYPVDNR